MSYSSTTVLESQLDWLTVAAHTSEHAHSLALLAADLTAAEARARAKTSPFRLMGYEGWRTGRVRFGMRDEWALLQLSGDLAEQRVTEVLPVADSITRVDFAVTARTAEPDPHVGGNAYLMATHHAADHPKAAMVSRTTDNKGGETLYIGHRSSDYFFRLYNKHAEALSRGDDAEADRYLNCWRYELECKGLAAAPLAMAAAGAGDRPSHVQSLVYHYSRDHGIEPVFSVDGDRVLRPGFRRRSDYESRLRWFQRAVRPSIQWALSHGDRQSVIDALGLGEGVNDLDA